MEIDNKLINLAVDSYFGRLGKEYSVADSQEVLRKALLEANNSKSTIRPEGNSRWQVQQPVQHHRGRR